MKMLAAALLLLTSCFAQDANHHFLDRTGTLALSGSAAVFAADAVTSCRNIYAGATEVSLPVHTCVGISAWMASSFATQTATAYLLHRTHHHRLERISEFIWSSGSVVGVTYTLNHPAHKPLATVAPRRHGPF